MAALMMRARPRRVEQLFHEAEAENLAPLLDFLGSRNDIRLIGGTDPQKRAPTVTFTSKTLTSAEIAEKLAYMQVMAGAGNFYAVRCLDGLGINPDDGVVRLSFVHYTSRKRSIRRLMHSNRFCSRLIF